MKITFEIDENDSSRFYALEAIATTTDQELIKFIEAMARRRSARRARTDQERKQAAIFYGVEVEDIAK